MKIFAILASSYIIYVVWKFLLGLYDGMKIESINDPLTKRLSMLVAFTISVVLILSISLIIHYLV
jgi:hypothetical protein